MALCKKQTHVLPQGESTILTSKGNAIPILPNLLFINPAAYVQALPPKEKALGISYLASLTYLLLE